jgi:hypothetical protein
MKLLLNLIRDDAAGANGHGLLALEVNECQGNRGAFARFQGQETQVTAEKFVLK